MVKELRLAIAGVGNCASSLIQGLFYYKNVNSSDELIPGLMHNILGGYRIADIKPVAAFDVDKRKVGKDLSEAIFAKPNCTKVFCKDVPKLGVMVMRGPTLDGIASHMKDYPEDRTFVVSDEKPIDVAKVLKETKADVLVNYMPVGSEDATRYYAECALKANCALVNCMPVFIASNQEWAQKFEKTGIPIIGDDIKSQLGATITHRVLTKLFSDRGVKIDRTYQLNTGGNSVTGDQEVMLSVNGRIRRVEIGNFIDSFVNIYGKKRADGKDIVIMGETGQDLKCFTVDHNFSAKLSNVDALIRHRISEPIYEVSTEGGRKIKITGDHNVFTLNNEGDLTEIPIKLVRKDETYIAVPRNLRFNAEEIRNIDLTPHLNDIFVDGVSGGLLKVRGHPEIKIPVNLPITDELLQVVGIWLADGSFDRLGSANMELACANDPECMEIVDDFVSDFNINYSVRKDGIAVRLFSKTLSGIFSTALGLRGNSYTKRIPEWVFGLSERQIALALKGYLSGDGCVTGKQIRWTSASEGLIRDMQALLLRIGINSTVFREIYGSEKCKSSYRTSMGHIWHGIISSKEDMELFTNKIGFLQAYKNQSAAEACSKLKRYGIHKVPNIALFKKWRIKSKTWYKHSSIRAHVVIRQLDKIKDAAEREKVINICCRDLQFLKIKGVKQVSAENTYVYDISTKPFERFVCSNILVHNTDFLNMLERSRLKSKKISKTESVQSQLPVRMKDENIHIGPSDYVPWQNDNKVCFIRMEGRKFGDAPIELELRLSVEDSPNSAGIVIDAIRCAKLAKDRSVSGPLLSSSAYFMKHPPQQFPDSVAKQMVEEFIKGERER